MPHCCWHQGRDPSFPIPSSISRWSTPSTQLYTRRFAERSGGMSRGGYMIDAARPRPQAAHSITCLRRAKRLLRPRQSAGALRLFFARRRRALPVARCRADRYSPASPTTSFAHEVTMLCSTVCDHLPSPAVRTCLDFTRDLPISAWQHSALHLSGSGPSRYSALTRHPRDRQPPHRDRPSVRQHSRLNQTAGQPSK